MSANPKITASKYQFVRNNPDGTLSLFVVTSTSMRAALRKFRAIRDSLSPIAIYSQLTGEIITRYTPAV